VEQHRQGHVFGLTLPGGYLIIC